MLKIHVVIPVLILFTFNAAAQDDKTSRFGIQVSYGNPHYIPSYADGAPSYKSRYYFDIGFLYLKPIFSNQLGWYDAIGN
jgi:hypothetical protein